MDCPRCKTSLTAVTYEGVEVDTCQGCGGEWLDAGELKQINDIREKTFSAEEIGIVKGIEKGSFLKERDMTEDLHCPKCQVVMKQFNYGADSGIAIDKCASCQGIWLDKDELEQVQILVEGWEKKLSGDLQKYKGMHQKLVSQMDKQSAVSKSPLLQSLINGFLWPFM